MLYICIYCCLCVYIAVCNSKTPSRSWMTQKSPSQQRLRAPTSPASTPRACKPASHYEPSMIVQLPSTESVALQSAFSTTTSPRQQWRHQQLAPASTMSATLGASTNRWSTPTSYRPVDSDHVAYRPATPDYEELNAPRDNVFATAASVQIVKASSEAKTGQRRTPVERPLEAWSGGMVCLLYTSPSPRDS